jgi:hypothetical protein
MVKSNDASWKKPFLVGWEGGFNKMTFSFSSESLIYKSEPLYDWTIIPPTKELLYTKRIGRFTAGISMLPGSDS